MKQERCVCACVLRPQTINTQQVDFINNGLLQFASEVDLFLQGGLLPPRQVKRCMYLIMCPESLHSPGSDCEIQPVKPTSSTSFKLACLLEC